MWCCFSCENRKPSHWLEVTGYSRDWLLISWIFCLHSVAFNVVMICVDVLFRSERAKELKAISNLYFKILLSYEFYKARNVLHAAGCAVLGKLFQMQEDKKNAIYWFRKSRGLWTTLTDAQHHCPKELEYLIGLLL